MTSVSCLILRLLFDGQGSKLDSTTILGTLEADDCPKAAEINMRTQIESADRELECFTPTIYNSAGRKSTIAVNSRQCRKQSEPEIGYGNPSSR